MKTTFDHTGSSFDSFLEEEGIREEVEAAAAKRVIAWQLEQAMEEQNKTKGALAREMHTSRTQVERLLDPANTAISVKIISRAADALGKKFSMSLVDREATGKKIVYVPFRKKRSSTTAAAKLFRSPAEVERSRPREGSKTSAKK